MAHNNEYKKNYSIPETETPLEVELAKYISKDELKYILTTKNRAAQLMSLQGKTVKELCDNGLIDDLKFADFDKLNRGMKGFLQGNMVWLVIPFSVLISWVYTSLEQVGDSTENPFEGSANDVPISQMSRTAEIDIREMLGETDLPPALQPKNNIIL